MHKHCTKKKNTYPNGTFETDIIKWHTSSLIHWDDYVNSTSYLSNSLFEKLDMFFFLTYTKNKSLGFFLSKSTHNTKSFLNVNCNDDSWDRRRELEEREILFHFFYSIFCLLFCQPVYHQIHRKLRSFNGQLRALLLYKIKTQRPPLSQPSLLLLISFPTQPHRTGQLFGWVGDKLIYYFLGTF